MVREKLHIVKFSSLILSLALFLSSCGVMEDSLLIKETDNIVATANLSDSLRDKSERHYSEVEAASRTGKNALGREPLSTMEIAAKAQPSVVAINTTGTEMTVLGEIPLTGAGSGVIISEDGYIVTNNHVVSNADDIKVALASGENYKAELVGTAPTKDLAVIKIDAKGLPAAVFGNSDDLLVGELAIAVGNPLGDFQGTVTSGIISSLGRTLILSSDNGPIELTNLIQTDAAINNGNSGGGLFNSYGELIGINVAKAGSASARATVEGLGFAIPANTAAPIINSLVNKGYVGGLPSLNIYGSNVSQSMANAYDGILVPGIWVRDISKGAAVAKAGLEVGDIITKFAGEEVYTVAELNLIKNRYKAGDKVEITFFRKGEYYDIEVVLDEAIQNK